MPGSLRKNCAKVYSPKDVRRRRFSARENIAAASIVMAGLDPAIQ
jgi:hypothetical protein